MDTINNCNIVKDLLPNYVDNLTSIDSTKLIENHIINCDECKKALNIMKSNSIIEDEKKYINYAKKVNRIFKSLKTALYMLLIVVLILITALFCITIKNYKKLSDDAYIHAEELYNAEQRIQELEKQLNGY